MQNQTNPQVNPQDKNKQQLPNQQKDQGKNQNQQGQQGKDPDRQKDLRTGEEQNNVSRQHLASDNDSKE